MEGVESKRGKGGSRSILVAIISSVVTAVVVIAVITSIFFGTKFCSKESDANTETFYVEVSDDPRQAKVQIRKADKIILTETARTVDNVDHTVTLQDFKKGLQAVKDIDKNKCFVFPTDAQFESMENIADRRQNTSSSKEVVVVDKTAVRDPIPPELLHLAVGDNIADFCEGLQSHWLIDPPGSDPQMGQRYRRRTLPYYPTIKIRITVTVKIEITIE